MWPTAVVTSDLAGMENIGNTAKAASKFEVPYVDVIIDVGVLKDVMRMLLRVLSIGWGMTGTR